MKRDGATTSMWQHTCASFQPKNGWNKKELFDVLIIGGGITGLTTALLLQTEGKKCLLAEAGNIGFGATGGTTAHLSTMPDTSYHQIENDYGPEEAKAVAAATREAIDLIEGLIGKYQIDAHFAYEPGFMIAGDQQQADQLEAIVAAAARAGVVIHKTNEVPLPLSFTAACRFEFQAKLHPTKYLAGLAQAFEEAGGVVLQQCLVTDVERKDDYLAKTTLGDIHAKQMVYATHIPPGLNSFNMRCAAYRSYAQAFTLSQGTYPAGLVYDLNEPYNYYRSEIIDGRPYMIAGGFDHKAGQHDNEEMIFTRQEAFLRERFPVDAIAYRWSSQYYVPVDGLPYIGTAPAEDRIYVATGFNGDGMTMGTLAAKIICELISTGKSKYESLFRPSRIKPVAGLAAFVKENANAVKEFFKNRMSTEPLSSLAGLAPGSGRVVEWEGEKVALYKHESGKLSMLSPVCPHAKCFVHWNSAEQSWDCPCHGSRFAPNGALLTGPATEGLQQILLDDLEGD